MKRINYKVLLKPQAILISIVIGIFMGLYLKSVSQYIAPFGKMYLSLIQMCVLPIMITAVISGFGNLFYSNSARVYIKRLLIVFIVGLIASAIFGIIMGVLGNPGDISENAKLLLSQNINPGQDVILHNRPQLLNFFISIVPINIFAALNQGDMLAVLLFCILLGISLGCIRSQASKTTIVVLEGVFVALLKIVSWIMYGLPFGLCCLFAGYTAELGLSQLATLAHLILLFYISLGFMIVVYSLIIWYYVGGSYWNSIRSLKQSLLIAFGTSSSLSAIPAMLENLEKKFKIKKEVTDFVVPLGVSLNRHGTIVRLVISALFTLQLFNQPLTLENLFIILITSIFAGIAASGVPGIASVSVLALVLQPLGLPTSVGIALLTAIVPITDPLVTLVNVYCNCAAAIIVGKRKSAARQESYTFQPNSSE